MINLDEHITDHFTWREALYSEYAIRHGIDNVTGDPIILNNIVRLCSSLETIRAIWDLPIVVTSMYRRPDVNEAVGGSLTSAHPKGLACDFRIPPLSVLSVCKKIVDFFPDFDQLIYEYGESGWTHFGLSMTPPRKMILTAKKENGKTVYTYRLPENPF